MKTNYFISLRPGCLRSICLSAASLLFTVTTYAASPLVGNQSIVADTIANPSEPGNLSISGDLSISGGLDLGTTTVAENPVSAFQIQWALATKAVNLDVTDPAGTFSWRDNFGGGALVRNKMKLSDTNQLQVFNQDGSAPGITLDPNAGSLTLAGFNSGIYHSNGTPMVSFSPTGAVTFPTRPTFSDGIDFGSGQVLNNSNVSYMRGLMTNFGYRETPVVATPVQKFNLTNVTITSVASFGSYPNGSLYVVGYFIGGASLSNTLITSYGSQDAFVAKLYSSGSPQWVRVIGGASSDSATSVSVDSSENVYVGGTFEGATISLGASNITSAGSVDGYVAKFNGSGTLQWAKPVGGLALDNVSSVAVDGSGNLMAAGSFSGATTNLGASNITSAGGDDGYVAKLDSGGNIQWAKPIGSASVDRAASVAVDLNGNAVVAGTFGGAMLNLGSSNITTAGGEDGYLVKFNSGGVVQWAKPIGGLSSDSANSVVADSGGNLLVAGIIGGNTTNLGTSNLSWLGSSDGYVAKFDPTGTVQFAKQVAGTSYDVAERVSLDSSGNIYVAGTFQGNLSTLETANLMNNGANDGYVVRLDSSGGFIDSAAIGGSGTDLIKGVLAWGSQVFAWGSTGAPVGTLPASFDFGNTRISRGGFMVGWPALSVVTPSVIPTARLSWGSSAASGIGSTALGGGSFAQGPNSVALGNGVSTGTLSLSSGNAVASGLNSTALGTGTALGNYSVVLGSGIASGAWSVASGPGSRVSGQASLAGGANQTASPVEVTGISSIAWGQKLTVSGTFAQAFGYEHVVSGNCSAAFGWGNKAQSVGSFVAGTFNIPQGDPITTIQTDNLFVIGNGTADTARSNAITTLKSGRTTLTNKEWQANPTVVPTELNSNAEALVVEGHTRLEGATTLKGKVIIEQAQGDISMGIYQ